MPDDIELTAKAKAAWDDFMMEKQYNKTLALYDWMHHHPTGLSSTWAKIMGAVFEIHEQLFLLHYHVTHWPDPKITYIITSHNENGTVMQHNTDLSLNSMSAMHNSMILLGLWHTVETVLDEQFIATDEFFKPSSKD